MYTNTWLTDGPHGGIIELFHVQASAQQLVYQREGAYKRAAHEVATVGFFYHVFDAK